MHVCVIAALHMYMYVLATCHLYVYAHVHNVLGSDMMYV